jgi:very-short-patch-repair endonuclease
LRQSATDPEKMMWSLLRGRRFADYRFRRQVAIGPYVADFVCFNPRLIVELDGSQHADSEHDRLRDRWFADDDFRVLRIWNGDLLKNRTGVLDAIWNALQRPSSALRAPSPARGEGDGAVRLLETE